LLTARTSARPDFPFSRLISRLDCAQLRTGSAVKMGPTVAWQCAQWARSWHAKEAAKEGTAGVIARTINTSPGQPDGPSAAFLRVALRMFRANLEAKSVSIMRTRSAQIGVQSATFDVAA
jgi:hypothetical protein